MNDDLGLDMYDFGARFQDPALGRWFVVDALADEPEQIDKSPYAYAWNNPIYYTDPDGNCPSCWEFLKGFGKRVGNIVSGIAEGSTPVQIANFGNTLKQGKQRIQNIKDAYASGGFSGAVKQYGEELYDSSGAGDLVDRVEKAGNGDAEAIGGLAADVVAVVASKKLPKGKAKANNAAASANMLDDVPVTNEVYKRPNNATTSAQRASVQDKPCVDCGNTTTPMVADHKTPLVVEHYTTGNINKANMRTLGAVQPQCTACSAQQGGRMSAYSKKMKALIQSGVVKPLLDD